MFTHSSKLGNCSISTLEDTISVSKETPEFGKSTYHIAIDESKLPNGVTVRSL